MDKKPTTIFSLPPELYLAVIEALEVKDVIAFRQTCKTFYLTEKTYHDDIWKRQNLKLCTTIPLFSPTFTAAPPFAVDQETIAKRALITESILLEKHHETTASDAAVPTHKPPYEFVDLEGTPPMIYFIHSVFLLPGGRYLILINSSQLQVWDLLPFTRVPGPGQDAAEQSKEPKLLADLEIRWGTKAYASTVGGPDNTVVRIMLRSPFENSDPEIQQQYGISATDFVDVYAMYELSFAGEIPELKQIGELPLVRHGGFTMQLAFSTTSVLLQLEEHYGVVWNFVDNTYAFYRIFSPTLAGPMASQVYLSETHISIVVLRKNCFITMPIPPLRPLGAPPNHVLRLPPYTPVAGETSLLPNESKSPFVSTLLDNLTIPHIKHVVPKELEAFSDLMTAQPQWGIRPSETSRALIRDHHIDRIETAQYELISSGFLDLPESKIIGHAKHASYRGQHRGQPYAIIPPPDLEKSSWSYGGYLISVSLWGKLFNVRDDRAVHLSVSKLDDGGSEDGANQWKGGIWELAPALTPVLGLDFCALSGVMVVVTGPNAAMAAKNGFTHPVRIYDFTKPRLNK